MLCELRTPDHEAVHGCCGKWWCQDHYEWHRSLSHLEKVPASPVIPMILHCPKGHRHVDKGEFATKKHHTHACQKCGLVWRPAIVATVGVRFLPGFKDEETT